MYIYLVLINSFENGRLSDLETFLIWEGHSDRYMNLRYFTRRSLDKISDLSLKKRIERSVDEFFL